MREVVFIDCTRTLFGNIGGCLKDFSSAELAAIAMKGLAEKTGILERGKIDGVLYGNALRDAKTDAQARYAVLLAGLPIETEAQFIEVQCGSGIEAINQAAAMIGLGYADVMMVGGCESYSTVPAYYSMSNEPYKLIPPSPMPSLLSPIPGENINMTHVSDHMADKWGISREECDEFSCRSQMRLQEAYKKKITGPEIVPVVIPATKKKPEQSLIQDEFPKATTTIEILSKLRAVNPGGVTTAGNASGRNDGASFLLMMSKEAAGKMDYTPYARWITGADIGCYPSEMGIGPALSNVKAMKKAGLKIADFDVMECNEAFAAQNLSVIKEMEKLTGEKIDQNKWNPNGGAISIGHPNGASGGRCAWFAMMQLVQTGGRYGFFSSCCGGGQGISAIIENLRV